MKNDNTTIIIPARFGSSRYRGKPLIKILNREMILRVADICAKVVNKKNLYVATDSNKISRVVKKENYRVIMTSKKCLTGTDRVAQASKKIKSKIFINVQGDEPLINSLDIQAVIKAKKKYPNYVICGFDFINTHENPSNINIPKVIVNKKNDLIYMSRSVIPSNKKTNKNNKYLKQVCIYAFNKYELKCFSNKNKKTHLESIEDLELLRFMELGIKIKMVKLNSNSTAVDEKSDVLKVEKILKKLKKKKII